MGSILLSFDIEEFDLPLEYNMQVSEQQQFEFSREGLNKVVDFLNKNKIKATFFVTASFAVRYRSLIKQLSKNHEIASHNLNHKVKDFKEQEIQESKKIIESIIKKKIKGFRAPRFHKIDFQSLQKLGFKYDSSISPSFIPGRYNNYFEKRTITKRKGVYEIPVSTLPFLRLPLSWIFFRFFGLKYSKLVTLSSIKKTKFANLYFHPWEFNNLRKFKIPRYIKRNSGPKTIVLLNKYVNWCKKKNYQFKTFSEFLKL